MEATQSSTETFITTRNPHKPIVGSFFPKFLWLIHSNSLRGKPLSGRKPGGALGGLGEAPIAPKPKPALT